MVALGSTLIDTAKFGSNDVTAFYLGSNEAWTAGEPAELIKPTGIDYSGGSATLGTNGQVTFSGVTSLSLNGCFTADFDNYVLSLRDVGSDNLVIRSRLRTGGSDASGSDYTVQLLEVYSSTVSPARLTSQTSAVVGATDPDVRSGDWLMIYGPFLAQPTAMRNNNVYGDSNARLTDAASTHSLSTSYDGITLFLVSGNMTGNVHVFGYEE